MPAADAGGAATMPDPGPFTHIGLLYQGPAEYAAGCAAFVRIFTPARELAFAGHPTIGTAFVLRDEGVVPSPSERFALEEGVGLSEEQVLDVLRLPDEALEPLLELAHEVRMRWCGPEVEVEGIIPLKTGGCGCRRLPRRRVSASAASRGSSTPPCPWRPAGC